MCKTSTDLLLILNYMTGSNLQKFFFVVSNRLENPTCLSPIPLPQGYRPDDCGPRLTNAFVKTWATSNFEPPLSNFSFENINLWETNQPANNDLLPVENALYVCYNVFHGFCERLQLTNISNAIPWKRRSSLMDFYPKRTSDIPIPVVNWNASLSSTITVDGNHIFVGLEQDQFQDATFVDLDPISVRMRDFDYARKEPSVKSSLRFQENDFQIKYKFSFQYTLERGPGESHLYVYFVSQQPNKSRSDMLETRLVRFCSTPYFFHSYADLQLSCDGCVLSGRGHSQKQFGAFHMAVRGTVGTASATKRYSRLVNSKVVPKLRQPIVFSEDFNNVLLVAFAPQLTKPNEFLSPWNYRSLPKKPLVRGTAIAFYTMAEIDVYFGIVIYNCLSGRTSTGPSYLLSGYPKRCDRDDFLLPLLSTYCPTDPMNYPISGSLPSERLSAPPILMLDVDATGIAITRVAEEFTVLVVTTDEGELAKYEVEEDGRARLIASKRLTPRLRPLRGLTLDDTGLVAFAVSDDKVYRVELHNCSLAESCGACLAQRDPYCGWCLTEGICTHKSACGTSWLAYRSSPSGCPEIISIDPPGIDTNQGPGPARALTLRPSPQLLDAFLNADPIGQTRHRSRHLLCIFRYRNSSEEQEPAWRIRGDFYAQSVANFVPGSGEIACNFPRSTDLAVLGADEKTKITHVWLELTESSGASLGSTYPLASGDFVIYDCRKFTACQTCLSPQFDCIWHLTESRCLSRAGPLPSPPPSSSQTSLDNSNFGLCAKSNCTCPSFMVEHAVTTVESNHPVSVVATVSNVQTMANRFSCFENCTGRWIEGIYDSISSTVICNLPGMAVGSFVTPSGAMASNDSPAWHPDLLKFASRGLVKCEIAINWHNDRMANQPELGHPLVNSKDALLEVYECSRMAAHCDSCLALPPRFSCAWCFADASKSMGCFKAEMCDSAGPAESCVYPQLLQVIPENATINGQTLLTLRGINLGGRLEDLVVAAVFPDPKLKPIPCKVLPIDFRPFRQVKCRLHRGISSDSPRKSRIVLQLRQNDRQTNTSLPFIFLTPKIESFSPKRGPVSGGTVLRIYGQDLNIGASVTVYLAMEVNTKCEILSLSADLIKCRTQAVDPTLLPSVSDLETGNANGIRSYLAVLHDKSLTKASLQPYIFTPDPIIRTVTKTLIFLSGGTSIRVYGQHLDVIEQPWIVFYYNGMEFIEPCQPMLGYLSCLSPSLNHHAVRRRRDLYASSGTIVRAITNPSVIRKIYSAFEPDDEIATSVDKTRKAIVVPYGFVMDNVSDLLVYGIFPVYPDPEVFPFVEGRLVESFTPPSLAGPTKETPGGSAEGGQQDLNGTSEKSPSLQDLHLLRFHGNFGALAEFSDVHALEELSIVVAIKSGENGINMTCKPTVVKVDEIRCELNRKGLSEGIDYPVFIKFGRYLTAQPGVLQFKRLAPFGFRDRTVIVACSVIGVLALIACLFLAMWCRSRRTERDLEKRFQIRWIEQEKCVARAFKNDFIELQTHVDELVQDLNKGSLPVRDYQTYCLFSLFPEYHLSLVRPTNPHDMPPYLPRPGLDVFGDSPIIGTAFLRPHPLISSFEVSTNVQESANRGIFLFNRLLHNRHFLCLLIEAIESNLNIDARAKSQIASLLSIILHPDMEYFTQIILVLITDLLRSSRDHGGDSHLLTAFRRAESVVAKMLSNWFTFLLYNFIREHAAEHLFILYRALRQQINTGPQDAVTGLARYTLDAATLLKSDLLSRKITLLVIDPEGLFGHLCPSELPVRVLSCDTVTQTKEKILDTIYRNTPYRNQLRPTDVHLRKIVKAFDDGTEFSSIDLLMLDWDLEVRRGTPNAALDGPPYRLNCLSDYKMNDGDVVALVRARSSRSPPPSNGGGTLPAALPPNPTTAVPWGIYSCPPTAGESSSLPSHIHSNSLPPSNGQRQTAQTFNIRPTGGPSPLLWYHLERPTSTDLQASFLIMKLFSENQLAKKSRNFGLEQDSGEDMIVQIERGGVKQEGKSCICCRCSTSRKKSPQPLPSTLSTLTFTQQQQQLGGLDARSLRRWLASQSSTEAQNTAERVRTSQRPPRGGIRKTRRQTRRLFHKVGGSAAGETVELAPSWADEQDDAIDRSLTKLPCEIFLNRLLRTRVSVAKYMDRVFELIFGAVMDSQSPPLCIKFLFDFLDFQAESLGIHDPGVLHAWKANCLHLRFWNQILINLDYVFDIPLLRNTALERSFHSFSQAIAYACSPVLDKVTMDSPINKALFSSDIERHWLKVKKYFAEIKAMPAISLRDMNVSLCQHSKNHKNEFNVSWALYELYTHHVKLCYDTLVSELQTAIEAGNTPTTNLPFSGMGNTDGYPYSYSTGSLRDGTALTESQDADWDPLCLLQTLQEVNSCMMAVASSAANNSNGKTSTLRTSVSATTSPRSHRTFQHSHHRPTNGNGGGRGGGGGGAGGSNGAILRSAVPRSERRLPPLPSLP
ncbi:hypothetical protein Aperf_G00000026232 [Anoplocephala perfoliata]